jgi:predicted RNA-binding Zn-ribbon protein involved in translation (DUF1610 family)
MRRRAAIAVCCAGVGLLAWPVGALAARDPTARERTAIIAAARRTEGGEGVKVKVKDIRISTAGPWAVATVTIVLPASTQEQEEHFRRTAGRWTDTLREMPLADQRNLGLADAAFWGYFEIYLLVGWAFALASVVDVLMQPAAAFAAVGRSKWRWLLIELLGGVLAGVFTWAWYAFAVRPGVVRAGGRRGWLAVAVPVAVLRFLGSLGGGSGGSGGQRSRRPPERFEMPSTPAESPASRLPCTQCGGSRMLACLECRYTADGLVCNVCGGRGQVPCFSCPA